LGCQKSIDLTVDSDSEVSSVMFTNEKKGKNNIPTIIILDLNAELDEINGSSYSNSQNASIPHLPEIKFEDIKHLKFKIKQAYRVHGYKKVEKNLFQNLSESNPKLIHFCNLLNNEL
jgi:hypothetical protein